MGGVCSLRGRDEKCIQYFGLENLKGREHLEDRGINREVIIEWVLGKVWTGSM
jgi:hypothetical protein